MGHAGFINRLWKCEHVKQWHDSKTEKLDDFGCARCFVWCKGFQKDTDDLMNFKWETRNNNNG